MEMDELKLEIKKVIISALELEDIKPENILIVKRINLITLILKNLNYT